MKKGIIFDMDGTLWDSSSAVADCWTEVLREQYAGLRVITEEDMQGVMGLTMDKLAEALFPDTEEIRRMEIVEACCEAENAYLTLHGAVLYDHLEEVLRCLQKDYYLYIVSNCQSGYIESFLNHYGFGPFFEDIECYGNNQLKKGDNIANIVKRNGLEKAVYVGDIQGDYDASCEAGISFIHAAYGFGTIEQEVPKIESFSQLPRVVEALLN